MCNNVRDRLKGKTTIIIILVIQFDVLDMACGSNSYIYPLSLSLYQSLSFSLSFNLSLSLSHAHTHTLTHLVGDTCIFFERHVRAKMHWSH